MYWLNGALRRDIHIDPADRGFTLGDGVFETFAVRDGAPMHVAEHLARLRNGLAVLDIPIAYSDAEMADAVAQVLAALSIDDGSARLTVTRGPAPRGVLPPARPNPTVLISAAGGGAAAGGPVRLITAQRTRRNEHSPISRIKSLNYLDNIIARQEAQAAGFDDAVLLNGAGRATETTISNVFWDVDGTWFTAPESEGVLPGIARAQVLNQCTVAVRPVTVQDMHKARAAVVTNSLAARPVSALDGRDLAAESDLFKAIEQVLR